MAARTRKKEFFEEGPVQELDVLSSEVGCNLAKKGEGRIIKKTHHTSHKTLKRLRAPEKWGWGEDAKKRAVITPV